MHMTHCSLSSGLSVCVCNITARLALRTTAGRLAVTWWVYIPRIVDATGSWSYIPGNVCVSSQHTHTHTHERHHNTHCSRSFRGVSRRLEGVPTLVLQDVQTRGGRRRGR